MKNIYMMVAMLSASSASAGGWEASRLNTSFMYQKGNYAEASLSSMSYNITANAMNNADGSNPTYNNKVKTAKDQTRRVVSFKTSYDKFDIGLTRFRSGDIQMSGGAGTFLVDGTTLGGSLVPDANAPLNTLSLLGSYGVNDNIDVILGVSHNKLEKGTVTTSRGIYDIVGTSSTGTIAGVAYSKPDIALRVELVFQPKSELKTDTVYTRSVVGQAAGAVSNLSFQSTLSRPQTLTLTFQSGVAENTLVYGSIHKAAWKKSQISVPATTAAGRTGGAADVGSVFNDTTAYSLGVARKVSDSLALTASYNAESGSGKAATSLFTMTNGYKGISLGARYTIDNITVSCGYNYTKVGDTTVNVIQAIYENNTISTIGLKVGVSF